MNNIINALNELSIYQFRTESSYSDNDAQRNLKGRTHYVDDATLKCFKARILRGCNSKNGLYYVLQESLPHPDFDMKRVRRNVVFNVFGRVIHEFRDVCHTSALKADKHFSDALAWCDSDNGINELTKELNDYITRLDNKAFNAKQALTVTV